MSIPIQLPDEANADANFEAERRAADLRVLGAGLDRLLLDIPERNHDALLKHYGETVRSAIEVGKAIERKKIVAGV